MIYRDAIFRVLRYGPADFERGWGGDRCASGFGVCFLLSHSLHTKPFCEEEVHHWYNADRYAYVHGLFYLGHRDRKVLHPACYLELTNPNQP